MKSAPRSMRRQSGMGMFGWIAILLMVGTLGLVGLRLFPMYTNYFHVLDVAKTLSADPSIRAKSKSELKVIVKQRFRQNNLYDMDPGVLSFTKNASQQLIVTIDYEVRAKIFGNLEIVAVFKRTLFPR